jgi:4-amino-4-deoxy-L-arabinose transferase-like glycosyltransferase
MFFFTAFYFGLKWFKEGKWKNIIFSALATGFGMMTKLSIGLIAFPLGFLFIVKLVKDLKAKKEGGKTFLNLVVFGLISVPLGLWFQIRNYLLYKTPLTYVLISDNHYQDISRFTPFQRLFDFYGFPIEDYYINLGSDGEQDYNIFITEVKTLLFGEENYRDDFLMSMAGYALLITLLIMILITAAGFVVTAFKAKKSGYLWEHLSMIVLALTQTYSIVSFALKLPHICSVNFRFSTPLVLCSVLFYTKICDIKLKGANKDLVTKITRAVAIAFMLFAIVFYTILWTYVKGEVVVADATW